MNNFRTLFGFNTQLIQYLRQNPLNEVFPVEDGLGAIYLGNIYAAYSLEILKRNNITAVLTVAAGTNLKYSPENDIKHLVIMADDIDHYNLSRHFERMSDFIHKCRQEGRNILVHCFAGISRSTTSIVAYMMREKGWGFRKILSMIRAKRKEINPNPGFIRQLGAYERKLKTQKNNMNGQDHSIMPSLTPNAANRSKSWNTNNNSANKSTVLNYNYRPQNMYMSGKKMPISGGQKDNEIQNQNQQQYESQQGKVKSPMIGNYSPFGSPQKNSAQQNQSNKLMGQQYQVHLQQQQQNNQVFQQQPATHIPQQNRLGYQKNGGFNKASPYKNNNANIFNNPYKQNGFSQNNFIIGKSQRTPTKQIQQQYMSNTAKKPEHNNYMSSPQKNINNLSVKYRSAYANSSKK